MKHNNKSGFTLIEILVVVFIFGIIIAMLARTVAGKSEGKRVGVLTKFSHKGLFIKSYEGELNMGGIRNYTDSNGRQGTVANVWEFSCSNPDVAKQLDNLVGKEVSIKYLQSFQKFKMDTSYDAISVEEVK